MLQLHHFHLSAASYRVRIALEFKGLPWQSHIVSLVRGGGQQLRPAYRSLNPQGLVPTLTDDDFVLSQSLAILEYLEEVHPQPSYFPHSPALRARARQFASLIVTDIQSLTSLRVLAHLRLRLNASDEQRSLWIRQWLVEGLDALELWLTSQGGLHSFCVGTQISIADICLVPLMYAARRFALPLDDFPRLCEVEAACLALPAFQRAHPDNHPEPAS